MEAEELLNYAVEAQTRSQSKYSNFPVGCAILTKCDNVILGCNIESAAYPSTMCAERVAIYSALSQGFIEFKAIAIVSKIGAKPCGPCRQIIHEYLGDIPIYISDGSTTDYDTQTINVLLPYPFG